MRILDTVFVSGYTQAPKGTKLHENGSTVGVMLEIDRETHKIVGAECTFITDLAQDFFQKMLIGLKFDDGLDEINETIENNLYIPSTHSIMVAIKVAHQRYRDNVLVNE